MGGGLAQRLGPVALYALGQHGAEGVDVVRRRAALEVFLDDEVVMGPAVYGGFPAIYLLLSRNTPPRRNCVEIFWEPVQWRDQ